jgi:hypothetical protein
MVVNSILLPLDLLGGLVIGPVHLVNHSLLAFRDLGIGIPFGLLYQLVCLVLLLLLSLFQFVLLDLGFSLNCFLRRLHSLFIILVVFIEGLNFLI